MAWAWLEVYLDDDDLRRNKCTKLPLECAEYPGGWLCWLKSLNLKPIADEEDDDDYHDNEPAKYVRPNPNWNTHPAWFEERRFKPVGCGHSDTRPHEAYEPEPPPAVLSGRFLNGKEQPVEKEKKEMKALFSASVADQCVTPVTPATVRFPYELLAKALMDRDVRHDSGRIGQVVNWHTDEPTCVTVQVHGIGGFEAWPMYELNLAETVEAKGQQELTVQDLRPVEVPRPKKQRPRTRIEPETDITPKADTDFARWKREEAPSLVQMVKDGYNPDAHPLLKNLSAPHREYVLKKAKYRR